MYFLKVVDESFTHWINLENVTVIQDNAESVTIFSTDADRDGMKFTGEAAARIRERMEQTYTHMTA